MAVVETLFAQWRVVNQLANDAEHRIFEATLRFASGQGPAPSDEDHAQAAELRSDARTLFARALAEAEATVAATRRVLSQESPAGRN